MNRRGYLKDLAVTGAVLGGFPVNVSSRKNNIAQYIAENGYYSVSNAGTRPPIKHAFRSKHPLRKETDTGGVVWVRPQAGGIRAGIEPTENDQVAGSGFNSEKILLDDIQKITGKVQGGQVGVTLWIEDPRERFNSQIFEWDNVSGNEERRVSLDKDHVARGPELGPGKFEVSRDTVFYDKTSAARGDIDRWQEVLGDKAEARVTIGVLGDSRREVTINQFDIKS